MSKNKKTGSVKLNLDAETSDTDQTEDPKTKTQEPPATPAPEETETENKPDNEVSKDASRGGRYISLGGGQYKRVDAESTNE